MSATRKLRKLFTLLTSERCFEEDLWLVGSRATAGIENDPEAEAPLLTGRALDEYAAENAQKLFGKLVNVVATAEDVVDHVEHAVKIVGIDHVDIGSDSDGIAATANGLEDISKMPALVAVLLKRGYAESGLKKILGENYLCVIREVTDE